MVEGESLRLTVEGLAGVNTKFVGTHNVLVDYFRGEFNPVAAAAARRENYR